MTTMNRRSFLLLGSGAVASVRLLGTCTRVLAQGAGAGPVVETAAGRLRGIALNGVQAFKGVPYGAPTSGAGRFMRPRKPESWTGVREATAFGPRAPQPFRAMV